MRLTKFGHACVRIEHDGHVVVVDPGSFTSREAVDGATAVLVTHEHPDHLDAGHLAATTAAVFTIEAVRDRVAAADGTVAERVQVVAPGERLDVGLPVTVVGELHAVIHEDLPRFRNSGFLLEVDGTRIYHPGDSFTPAGGPVDVLLLPATAPWSKVSEVVDFARAVGAPTTVAVHDGILNDAGLAIMDRNLGGLVDGYQRVAPGSDVSL
ncbi:MAG TPA: MBL fold metallo-hydrolase [Nocardioidaceae bacterium]|nr:MBL fold metallo-hydrolase [Nocardioidaceae bacterium]